jgi:hypothetical protein
MFYQVFDDITKQNIDFCRSYGKLITLKTEHLIIVTEHQSLLTNIIIQ